jgi:hypothetical protein
MPRRQWTPTPAAVLRDGAALAVVSYAAYAGFTWLRFGHPARPTDAEADPLLDRFMPVYDVVERHHVRVSAPAALTMGAAVEQNLFDSAPVRAILAIRQLALGGVQAPRTETKNIVEEVQAIGWRILAEEPGREIVFGAVTRPWKADVTFRGVTPDEFAAFEEPAYVKIAWTLRADPVGPRLSIFRTETRAAATDAEARTRFRRYWSFVSPGVSLIRWLSLGPLKREAERRARREG